MNQTQAGSKCTNETGSSQEIPHDFNMIVNLGQDNTHPQDTTANITRCLPTTSQDEQTSQDFTSGEENFNMALKLFPEFRLQDIHEGNRSQDNKTAEMMMVKTVSLNHEGNDINLNCKTSKDIVQWIRNEYGIC